MRELFESTVERLLADLSTPEAVLDSEGGRWPASLWAAVEESGFALAAAPESSGGAGASWDDLFPVLLACGRHCAPLPLPEAILGNWLLGSAGLEAVGGPLSVAVDARLNWVDGMLSGSLGGVPWGRHVAHVVALVGNEVVLLSTESASTVNEGQNTAGEARDDLSFSGAAPIASAAAPAGLGADTLLQGAALLRAAQTAGALQAVLTMCIQHATERVQFGKPIGSFQAIGHQIAVLAEQVALATVTAEAACAEFAPLRIASAKVCSAEASGIAAGIAHAVHGAMGFTHEHRLHLSTRRLWAWRSEYGSAREWSQRIGRLTCAGGAAAFWPAITAGEFK
ncbi:acyl-CoA dehydrogenase family protein [Paucibacter sp. R3-3]|uniref:Acyl-CoA dehydrogenase family protein n=1 Tax=Roseateles agri TaxID=3098619 RepID=A0ABU5DPG0_9BURK|nr:acyl-CoA dehydrogenase family protein [Paucibacter sp. R3-3]MDY0748183.1 acyl-CoA dehydrogenase family protein [Paucibacter sp. R3-3]